MPGMTIFIWPFRSYENPNYLLRLLPAHARLSPKVINFSLVATCPPTDDILPISTAAHQFASALISNSLTSGWFIRVANIKAVLPLLS
jgi:hypothetical protein